MNLLRKLRSYKNKEAIKLQNNIKPRQTRAKNTEKLHKKDTSTLLDNITLDSSDKSCRVNKEHLKTTMTDNTITLLQTEDEEADISNTSEARETSTDENNVNITKKQALKALPESFDKIATVIEDIAKGKSLISDETTVSIIKTGKEAVRMNIEATETQIIQDKKVTLVQKEDLDNAIVPAYPTIKYIIGDFSDDGSIIELKKSIETENVDFELAKNMNKDNVTDEIVPETNKMNNALVEEDKHIGLNPASKIEDRKLRFDARKVTIKDIIKKTGDVKLFQVPNKKKASNNEFVKNNGKDLIQNKFMKVNTTPNASEIIEISDDENDFIDLTLNDDSVRHTNIETNSLSILVKKLVTTNNSKGIDNNAELLTNADISQSDITAKEIDKTDFEELENIKRNGSNKVHDNLAVSNSFITFGDIVTNSSTVNGHIVVPMSDISDPFEVTTQTTTVIEGDNENKDIKGNENKTFENEFINFIERRVTNTSMVDDLQPKTSSEKDLEDKIGVDDNITEEIIQQGQFESDLTNIEKDLTQPSTCGLIFTAHVYMDNNQKFVKNCLTTENSNSDKNLNEDTESICSGYHSSDFEFISESEACEDTFIIKDKNRYPKKTNKRNRHQNCQNVLNYPRLDQNLLENYRNPSNERYANLFSGIYDPVVIQSFQNKALFITNQDSMRVEYNGLGLNMQISNLRRRNENVPENYKNEALETAKKIQQLYYPENKRSRRFN